MLLNSPPSSRARCTSALLLVGFVWVFTPLTSRAADETAGGPAAAKEEPAGSPGRDLFQLDLENLGKVEAAPARKELSATPSTTVNHEDVRDSSASSTGELLQNNASSVNARRTSALNLDPIVRGFNSQQVSASANGMTQWKTRVDVDSLFSQIDPGVVNNITIVDGPYTSLYGPAFAFLVADLFPTTRTDHGMEAHGSSIFNYESNGQALYARQNVVAAGTDYGLAASYGWRSGNDYLGGGSDDFLVPASHKKWDGFFAFSRDCAAGQAIEFNYLRTEINGLELPGVTYDLRQSHNDQFNLRYVVRDDRRGPERFVVQTWLHGTGYGVDGSSAGKQSTFLRQFITAPSAFVGDNTINISGDGRLDSTGLRSYVVLGERDFIETTWGVDYRRYSLRYAEFDVNLDGSLAWGGNVFGIPRSAQDDVGLLANTRMALTDALEVTGGGRIDYVHSQVLESDAVITQIADPSKLYYLPGVEEPSHLLGMAYLTSRVKSSEFLVWNAGVAFAMRAPSLAELYSDEPYVPMLRFGNTFIDGNSELAAEKNVQVDLGVNYQQERWTFGVRGFMANIYDYILPAPSNVVGTAPGTQTNFLGRDFSGFPSNLRGDISSGTPNADQSQAGYRYSNADHALLVGGDLHGEMPLADAWNFGGTLSYVQGTNFDPQQFVQDAFFPTGGYIVHTGGKEPLPGIYPLSGTLHLRWFQPRDERYSIEFISRFVARQNRVASTLAELPTNGFVVCSLRAHWQATQKLRLNAGVDNLFDTAYTQHGSLVIIGPGGRPTFVPEPGISAVVGAELRY